MDQKPQTQPGTGWPAPMTRLAGWILRQDALPYLHASHDRATAADLGLALTDLRVQARNPDAPDRLLPRMMEKFGLNPQQPGSAERRAMRDMERVCSHCPFTRQCEQALATSATRKTCSRICPNAMTLEALTKAH